LRDLLLLLRERMQQELRVAACGERCVPQLRE
jgi:hypothetical protein